MNKLRIYLGMILAAVLWTASMPVARAETAIAIQPAVTELSMTPGQRWEGTVRIGNPSSRPAVVRLSTINFAPPESTGEPPVPLLDETANERAASLAGWISLPVERIVIAPRSTARLAVALDIPAYAGPGLHRAGVLITQEGDGALNGAKVAATLTAGLAVRVHGQEMHDVVISALRASRRVAFSFPLSVNLKIENRGATVAVMDGLVDIEQIPGSGRVHKSLRALAGGRYLIPGESLERSVDVGAGDIGRMGLYRVQMSMFGEEELSRTVYFIVVPWPVILAVITALLAGIFGIRGLVFSAARRARRKLSPGRIPEHTV